MLARLLSLFDRGHHSWQEEAYNRAERRAFSSPFNEHNTSIEPKLNLFTLVAIRWIAIAGQAIAITGVLLLGFDVPAFWAMLVVLASAILNIALMSSRRLRSGHSNAWIGEGSAAFLLAFDLCQLGLLLMIIGGIVNPFSVLLLAPVTVSAATLSRFSTIIISLMAMTWAVLVTFVSWPLPGLDGSFEVPLYYRMGMMMAVELGIIFIAFYLSNMAEQSRTMASAFSSVHIALEREQRLAAIGGLAANAAHELGTPLATIAVVAKEMYKEAPEGSLKEDAELLVEEAARCRDTRTTA